VLWGSLSQKAHRALERPREPDQTPEGFLPSVFELEPSVEWEVEQKLKSIPVFRKEHLEETVRELCAFLDVADLEEWIRDDPWILTLPFDGVYSPKIRIFRAMGFDDDDIGRLLKAVPTVLAPNFPLLDQLNMLRRKLPEESLGLYGVPVTPASYLEVGDFLKKAPEAIQYKAQTPDEQAALQTQAQDDDDDDLNPFALPPSAAADDDPPPSPL